MKAAFTFLSAATLAAGAAISAEPAPKLVPRPLPGLGVVQLAPAGQGEPAIPALPSRPAPPAAANPETQNRARVLFIHRRADLPAAYTADLSKPAPETAGRSSTAVPVTQARPGKIRIIPKSEVAALLAQPEKPKSTESTP